jgi:hypothetical protein
VMLSPAPLLLHLIGGALASLSRPMGTRVAVAPPSLYPRLATLDMGRLSPFAARASSRFPRARRPC